MINQSSYRMLSYKRYSSLFIIALFLSVSSFTAVQAQDNVPVREYTNPDEMVRFDRSTPFTRMLDVVNQFSQENRGKVILDRTETTGPIGITVPPMHWKDALDLVLNVKGLVVLEQEDFYEIVTQQSISRDNQGTARPQTAAAGDTLKATTSTKEVRINAIFFEGNRRALREIGVDWSTLSENVPENVGSFVNQGQGGQGGGGGGGQGGGGQGQGQFPTTGFNDGPFVQVNSRGAQSVSQNVFNALVNVGELGNTGIEVQALFSAFEADNLGEILASPSVKVIDGQAGRIQVGQDFSIKQRDFAGNVTDEFFSVGTILEVTPTVIEQRDTTFIHLDINSERSSAQPDPVSTIINKQQASTQSILLDGEATVIAGLYRTDQTEVRRGIPILKDLPAWFFGLRYLFGYNSEDYQMRELVVLIEASIEPGIPERFAQRNELPDKFDVLNEERNRVRDEIIEHTQNDNLISDEELGNDGQGSESSSGNQADAEMEMDSSNVASKEEEMKEPKVEDTGDEEEKPAAMKKEDEPKAEEPPVVDPEVKSESIPLNFSSDTNTVDEKTVDTNTVESNNEPVASQEEAEEEPMEPEEETAMTTESEENTASGQAASSNSDFAYYIIAGAFNNNSNATSYKDGLVEQGYDAQIFQKSGSEMLFVAYKGYNNLDRAKTDLADIIQYENDGAWLYRKN